MLVAAVVVLGSVAPGAGAAGNGWSGSITVVGQGSHSSEQGSYSISQVTVYAFDGTVSPGSPSSSPNQVRWSQPTTWVSSMHWSQNGPCGDGGSGGFTESAGGSGQGAGTVTIGNGNDDPSAYFIDVAADDPNGMANTVNQAPCPPGEAETLHSTWGACAADGSGTVALGMSATALHGSQTFDTQHGCFSLMTTTTVSWSLARDIIDADHDGWDDTTQDNCTPDMLPGDQQVGNPPITLPASYNPDQSINPCTQPPACANGRDDDGDGWADYPEDPGCKSAEGTDEAPNPQCSDQLDNDNDGSVDFNGLLDKFDGTRGPADPGCKDKYDDSEADSVTLTVTKSGQGAGVVSGAGINCGPTCTQRYERGTRITLTPTPGQGSRFDHWEGACTGTGGCIVTMNDDKTVTAVFMPTSGTIVIDEVTTPKSLDKQFKFGSSLPGLTSFTLNDASAPAHATGLAPGVYAITQKPTGRQVATHRHCV